MNPIPAFAVDRVDRIDPRVQERSSRKRDPRPLPAPEKGEREPDEPAPAPRDDDDDDEPHLIDLLVRSRGLPTRQILPGRDGAPLSSRRKGAKHAQALRLH